MNLKNKPDFKQGLMVAAALLSTLLVVSCKPHNNFNELDKLLTTNQMNDVCGEEYYHDRYEKTNQYLESIFYSAQRGLLLENQKMQAALDNGNPMTIPMIPENTFSVQRVARPDVSMLHNISKAASDMMLLDEREMFDKIDEFCSYL